MKAWIFFTFLIFFAPKNYAVTTENDPTRANLKIDAAYIDERGVILLKFNEHTSKPSFIGNINFTCYKNKCYQLDTRGSYLGYSDKNEVSEIKTNFEIENGKYASWIVNAEKGEAFYKCPNLQRKLKSMSPKEIEELSNGIHSGKIIVESMPEESRKPMHYYEDQDKNIIVVDRTKYFVKGTYRFFEGKSDDLKEVKVIKANEFIAGSVSLELEDGREIDAGKAYPTMTKGKQIYKYESAYYVDFSKIKMPDAGLYDLKLQTPCSISIDERSELCIDTNECKKSVQVNDTSRNISKPSPLQLKTEPATPVTIPK